jgi:hypothetical protein
MDAWMGGSVEIKAVLCFSYSNQKYQNGQLAWLRLFKLSNHFLLKECASVGCMCRWSPNRSHAASLSILIRDGGNFWTINWMQKGIWDLNRRPLGPKIFFTNLMLNLLWRWCLEGEKVFYIPQIFYNMCKPILIEIVWQTTLLQVNAEISFWI